MTDHQIPADRRQTTVHAYQIQPGDEFRAENGQLHWTCIEEPDWYSDAVRVRVQYVDGGIGFREWLSHQDVLVWRRS